MLSKGWKRSIATLLISFYVDVVVKVEKFGSQGVGFGYHTVLWSLIKIAVTLTYTFTLWGTDVLVICDRGMKNTCTLNPR